MEATDSAVSDGPQYDETQSSIRLRQSDLRLDLLRGLEVLGPAPAFVAQRLNSCSSHFRLVLAPLGRDVLGGRADRRSPRAEAGSTSGS